LTNGFLHGLTLVGIAVLHYSRSGGKTVTDYSHTRSRDRLALGEYRRQISFYREKSIVERKKLPVEPKRADVILAGAYRLKGS